MIRSVFTASKDSVLLSIDYGNQEVQVGARIFGDTKLIEMLERGLNMHDENTKIFFGIGPNDPKWGKLRKVSKIIMFGRLLYGGTDRGIYTQVMTAVPDCGLTFKRFCEAVRNYMDAHPEFALWCVKVQELAERRAISINAFGRVRTLLASANSASRQALNNPIQGSSADVTRDAIIDIRRALKAGNYKSKLILAVHDELLMDVRLNELKEVYAIMTKAMGKELTVNGYKFRIPLDAELGKFWGEMQAFDEDTFEMKGGSKH
jgi:DNA polymerase-1